jgi:hypothetical protein
METTRMWGPWSAATVLNHEVIRGIMS